MAAEASEHGASEEAHAEGKGGGGNKGGGSKGSEPKPGTPAFFVKMRQAAKAKKEAARGGGPGEGR